MQARRNAKRAAPAVLTSDGVDPGTARTLIEAVAEGVLVVDRDGVVRDSSEGAVRLLGKPRGSIMGSSADAHIAPEFRSDVMGLINQVAHTPAGEPMEPVEAELAGPRRLPVEVRVARTLFQGADRCLVLLRDITRRKGLEAEGRKALEKLRQLDAAKTEFINMAAHELRTPLAPIRAELSLLKDARSHEMGNDQRRSVGTLVRNVERLSKFVEDLLEVSRMQAGKIRIEPQPTDLAKMIRGTVDLFEAAAKYAHIQVKAEARGSVKVLADPVRMDQVVFNLVSNAVKYSIPGGRVTVRLTRGAKQVRVDVIDTGIGIRPEDLPRLFRPFGMIEKDRQNRQKGAGLGLYICKTLVELHGGKISCTSRGPNKGCTFTFTLPIRKTARKLPK